MLIQINNKFRITSDKYNFILEKLQEIKDETEKETYKRVGFFGSMESLFVALFNLMVRESTATSLKELKVDVKSVKQELKDLFNDIEHIKL